jgi:hypothetical protein
MVVLSLVLAVIGPVWSFAQEAAPGQPAPAQPPAAQPAPAPAPAPEQAPPAARPEVPQLEGPPPIAEVALVPTLPTTPVRRGSAGFNEQMVDASLLPRDKEGIWVLEFAFKPVRLRTVETGKGRRSVHYLYYHVVNRTGKPRMFVPQFSLVTDTGQRLEDAVIPQAIPIIQAREDASIPLRGAVDIMGVIPPSTKEGIDDAVYGVAVWDGVDPKADRFSIYVRGLSDGYQVLQPPDGGKPVVRYKTLRIDLIRRGDEHNLNEREIQLNDPSYEWVYW